MKKISIHGSFADIISRIEHHNDTTTPHYMFTTEVTMDNDNSKEEIAEMFKTCLGFEIVAYGGDDDNEAEGSIEFTVKRPQAKIDEFHEDRKHLLKCNIKELKSKCDLKEEYKEEILIYLKHIKQDWIIEAMEN